MGWTAWCDFLPTIDDEYRFTRPMWEVTLKLLYLLNSIKHYRSFWRCVKLSFHFISILSGIKNISDINIFIHYPVDNFVMAFYYPAVT